jgi:hypothetical protein
MPTSRRQPARPDLPISQVIGLIPHLFGSVPDGRVVLVGYLRTGPYSAYSLPLTPDLRQDAEPLIGHMRETGIRGVLAVAYDAAFPAQAAADVIAETAGQSGLRLIDAVRAGPDRFWSCIRPGPSAGTAIQHPDPAAARSAARYSPGLGTLAELTAPAADPRAEVVTRQALTQLGELTARKSVAEERRTIAVQGIASTVRAMSVYQHEGRLVSGSQLTWLSVLLGEEWVRDDALARMDPRHSEAHRRLWLDVTLHARRGYRAAPATLLGYASWQSGDRPMADIALKLAVSDQTDSLVRRLAAAIASGASPAPPPMTPDEVSRYHTRRLGLRPDAQWRRGAEPPEAG